MLILLCVIFLIIIVLCAFSECEFTALIFGMLFVGCLLGLVYNVNIVLNARIIDDEIAMYEEENQKIENDIDRLVIQYMKYESETLGNLKGDSSITLVSLYPDLKSDELVKTQIETYQANNEMIKQLKSDKLKVSVAKWWLYFGK